MKKRLFAGLLALCMTVNLMSATAFAAEATNEPVVTEDEAEAVCSELEGCSEGVHVEECAIIVAAKAAEEAAKEAEQEAKCAEFGCTEDSHVAKCGQYVVPCIKNVNCEADVHEEECYWYDFNPSIPCDITEGCEMPKKHLGECSVAVTYEDPKVATVEGTGYATFEEAVSAAKPDDTITLLSDITLSSDLTLPADVTLNGNGKQINGNIFASGDLTFAGYTKVTSFNAGYNKPTITIGEGACLEMTGTGRMVVGHGATFNITGSIENAKTVDKANITPSLVMSGASFTGSGVTFNVTNAYISTTGPQPQSTSSKTASGTFDFNISNSIWEQTGKLAFEAQSTAATVNFELKDSVLTTTSHLVFGVSKGEVVIDNSNVNVGTSRQIENRSTMTVKNGSVVNGAVATSSNAKNPGTLIIENATYAVTGEFSGSDLGTGTIILKKDADFTAGSITKANITIDATDMAIGDSIKINVKNLSEDTITVLNNTASFIIDGGKIIINKKYVAEVGETGYETLEAAFKAVTAENNTVEILSDIVIDEDWDARYTGSKFTVPVTINGNRHTIRFENKVYDGGNHLAAFRFESDATVNELTIDMSEALSGFQTRIRAISTKADLTVNNCIFIGNGSENNTRAIIFGESSGEAIGEVDVVVTNSIFKNWRRAVSDNENAQDAKSVNLTNCIFENSDVYVSAKETVAINNNKFSNSSVDIRSYSSNTTLNAVAKENTLDANKEYLVYNFAEADVQDGFVISAVTKVGNKFYGTLSTAVKAAQSGDTIIVLKDVTEVITIPAGKNLTLDLNGFVISSNDDTIQVVDDNTVLTITDSSAAKTGKVVSDGNYRGALYVKNGKVVIEGGTFEGKNNEKCYAAYVSDDGTLVVNGGTLKASGSGSAWGVIAYGSDSITLNDGEIISNRIGISGNGSDNYEAPITINGGIITAKTMGIYFPADSELTITEGTIQGATAVYFKSGNLTITGGKFVANGQKVDYGYVASGSNETGDAIVIENVGAEGYQAIGKVSITGGTFTSINAKAIGSYTAGKGEVAVTGFITGGTFNTNPSTYVASGYESVAKGDDYVVGKHETKAVAGTSPSCNSTGTAAHYKCDFCGKLYSDASGAAEKEVTASSLEIPAKGHSYSKKSDDSNHWSECSRCGDKKDKAGHKYSNGKCSCGHETKVEVYVPETPAPAPTPAPTPEKPATTTKTETTTTKPVEELAKPAETPVEEVVVDTKIVKEVATEEVKAVVKETVTVAEVKEVEKETEAGTVIVTEVKVAVTTETIDKVIENTEAGATVILPLTEAAEEGQAVTEAEVAVEALEKIIEAEAALTVEFEGVKVTLEADTIKAIAEQAQGSTIELRVVPVEHHELNDEQKAVLEAHDVAVRVSAQIFSDGEYIGDFKGGKATIAIPFTPEEGKAAEDHKVYFVDDNGEMTLMPAVYVDGHMVFETTHFSDYVIVYDEVASAEEGPSPVDDDMAVEAPVEEVQEEAGLPIVPIIIIVAAIILVVAFVATRKRNDKE